ncbi:hypothetical protein RH915_10435 [Serpentinicella sp. ANB-PHB4]|uniref:hypothetical protein n=1 Tax=Serpentinicella sp. ANB-PHB4 TaxID=3074076 RepID=UPI0028658295|nr:hypothetical protein [Serpentinicella sp. ANB-PHB4]MDR5659905.1 hypothetical protein [Serpentinicella sp. ANB-PHB4]
MHKIIEEKLDSCIVVKNQRYELKLKIFEPTEIRKLIPCLFVSSLFPVFFLLFIPPSPSEWISFNKIIFIPYTLLSVLLFVFAQRFRITLFSYMSFSNTLITLNFLVLGLQAMNQLNLKSIVIIGVTYGINLILIILNREKILIWVTNSGGNEIIFPVMVATIGAIAGRIIYLFVPDLALTIGGLVFVFSSYIFLIGIPLNLYKWYLLKKEGL